MVDIVFFSYCIAAIAMGVLFNHSIENIIVLIRSKFFFIKCGREHLYILGVEHIALM